MNYSRLNIILFLFFIVTVSCRREKYVEQQPKTDATLSEQQIIEANRAMLKKDKQRIMGYIERAGWQMKESDIGYWYEYLKNGNGDSVTEGRVATINYELLLLDGTRCYSSDELGHKQFVIGQGGIEIGLEYAIRYMRVGDKVRYIFPPHLAYGYTGDGKKIPSRSIIIYTVELISLTNP